MKIETKFNVGDSICFLHMNRVIESVIRKIETETCNIAANADKGEVSIMTEITYLCNKESDQRVHLKVEEKCAFKSKNELLKSL